MRSTAAALARLGRVLEARSDVRAGIATNSNFAGPEHFVAAGAKPGSRKNERGPLKRTAGIPEIGHAKYQQSKAESRKNLARSPIVFVIVQETRDPHFQ
jgi:hypothetical protein